MAQEGRLEQKKERSKNRPRRGVQLERNGVQLGGREVEMYWLTGTYGKTEKGSDVLGRGMQI